MNANLKEEGDRRVKELEEEEFKEKIDGFFDMIIEMQKVIVENAEKIQELEREIEEIKKGD